MTYAANAIKHDMNLSSSYMQILNVFLYLSTLYVHFMNIIGNKTVFTIGLLLLGCPKHSIF